MSEYSQYRIKEVSHKGKVCFIPQTRIRAIKLFFIWDMFTPWFNISISNVANSFTSPQEFKTYLEARHAIAEYGKEATETYHEIKL